MKLNKKIVDTLNKDLRKLRVGFNYELDKDTCSAKLNVCSGITNWVIDSNIRLDSTYYMWLEEYFKINYNVKLNYNNTRLTFWIDE